MSPQTFIFIGPSGAGKGTQSRLLLEYLKRLDPNTNTFYLESGAKFRELISKEGYTSSLARKVNDKGELQPGFLSIHIWSHIFIEDFKGHEHAVIDGTPRTITEAEVLDSALKFYGKMNAKVVFLRVSDSWARERLLGRGRHDDSGEDSIARKMEWFKRDVLPTVEYLRNKEGYDFFEINGEQSIEEVHNEVLEKIGLLKNND